MADNSSRAPGGLVRQTPPVASCDAVFVTSARLDEPRFEGHDEVVRTCARILRRAAEFNAWPAKTSEHFAQLVATAAEEARVRAAKSLTFLRHSAATTPALSPSLIALEREYDLASGAPVRGHARTPLTSVVARTTASVEVIEAAELLERIERRTIDAINLDAARARSRRIVDWKSPNEVDWQLAVAAAELEFALQTLPADFTPRERHEPLPTRASRFPWQSLFLSGSLSSLVAFVTMRCLLWFATHEAEAGGHGRPSLVACRSGSELEGLSGALCTLAKSAGLVVAAGAVSFIGFLVTLSVLTLVLVVRKPTGAPLR